VNRGVADPAAPLDAFHDSAVTDFRGHSTARGSGYPSAASARNTRAPLNAIDLLPVELALIFPFGSGHAQFV
jgi:hypothetical protein